ncbi:hypothetical protein L6452_42913 [Arctium lappa]|uniref:Uncharacterized protein n=1 Tax=Arctium lappa TaxID=4217 RepID=A0ACB8XIY8_ARCLA|nr:hypothetical protein L6452_42913 [Arctium lappa]
MALVFLLIHLRRGLRTLVTVVVNAVTVGNAILLETDTSRASNALEDILVIGITRTIYDRTDQSLIKTNCKYEYSIGS